MVAGFAEITEIKEVLAAGPDLNRRPLFYDYQLFYKGQTTTLSPDRN
jgi:hypothetical protein